MWEVEEAGLDLRSKLKCEQAAEDADGGGDGLERYGAKAATAMDADASAADEKAGGDAPMNVDAAGGDHDAVAADAACCPQ